LINDFDFTQPKDLAEALKEMGRPGRLLPLAGGTNVCVNLKRAPLEADLVVDLSRLSALEEIEASTGALRLGARVSLARLLDWRPGGALEGLLRPMAAAFAGPLIRNLATVGGNLCDASPAADVSPPLLALEARVRLESQAGGARVLPLPDFFKGVRQTARRPDELMTAVEIPEPEAANRWYYYKLGKRRADAISIVSLAIAARIEAGKVEFIRIGLGAVAPVALRAQRAEALLRGEKLTESAIAAAAAAAAAEARPIDDFRASASYRRQMIETLVRRGLARISERSLRRPVRHV
jgi:CO/xanthine dehydrogenase FAD-binding subunit